MTIRKNRLYSLLLPTIFYTALTQGLTCTPEAIGEPPAPIPTNAEVPPPSPEATATLFASAAPVTVNPKTGTPTATPSPTVKTSAPVTNTSPTVAARTLCPNGSSTPVCMPCYDFCPIDPMLIANAKAASPFGSGDQCFCFGNVPSNFTKDEENILLGKWTHVDKRDFLNPFPPEEALQSPVVLLQCWWRSLDSTNPNSATAPRTSLDGVIGIVRATLVSGETVETPIPFAQPSCAVDLPSANGTKTPAHIFNVEVPLVFPEPVTFVHIIIKVPNLKNECFAASWQAYLIQ